jgi:hypothetical protein
MSGEIGLCLNNKKIVFRGRNGAYGGGERCVLREHHEALAHAHFEPWRGIGGWRIGSVQTYCMMSRNLGLLKAAPPRAPARWVGP